MSNTIKPEHDLKFKEIIEFINQPIMITDEIPEKYSKYPDEFIDLFKNQGRSETMKYVGGLYKINDIGTEYLEFIFDDAHLKSYLVNNLETQFYHDSKIVNVTTDSDSILTFSIQINKINRRKIHVVYHRDCMDGLAAASLFERLEGVCDRNHFAIEYHALQYGKKTNFLKGEENDIVFFVDFSLSYELLDVIAQRVKVLCIIDHHKTATADILNLVHKYKDTNKIVKYIYDVEECGASLTKKALSSYMPLKDGFLDTVFKYIRDRDLWLWEFEESKAFHEGLVYLTYDFKNDPIEFNNFIKNLCNNVDSGDSKMKEELLFIGRLILVQVERKVNKICKKLKDVENFNFKGVDFKLLNLNDNMSEVGNGICLQLNTPAMMYFVVDNTKVVFGLRSLDTLPDVSVIAKSMGGGGHRNACGFEVDIKDLNKILKVDLCSRIRKSVKSNVLSAAEKVKNIFKKKETEK